MGRPLETWQRHNGVVHPAFGDSMMPYAGPLGVVVHADSIMDLVGKESPGDTLQGLRGFLPFDVMTVESLIDGATDMVAAAKLHSVAQGHQTYSIWRVFLLGGQYWWQRLSWLHTYSDAPWDFEADANWATSAHLNEYEADTPEAAEIFTSLGYIILTAKLLQTENVTLGRVADPRPRKARKRIKRAVDYHTLLVKQNRHYVPVSDLETGVRMRKHLRRGHFRDYRNGSGLGRNRIKGVWWWRPHLVGDPELGRVYKDYELG